MKPRIKLNALDKFALAVSPGWGAGRIKNKLSVQMLSDDGFVIPGSRTKSMKGITARANSRCRHYKKTRWHTRVKS